MQTADWVGCARVEGLATFARVGHERDAGHVRALLRPQEYIYRSSSTKDTKRSQTRKRGRVATERRVKQFACGGREGKERGKRVRLAFVHFFVGLVGLAAFAC